MSAKENRVFQAAMKLIGSLNQSLPENVIWGYAKLLSMNDSMLKMLVGEDAESEIEEAHAWFAKNNISLELVKIKMQPFISCVIIDEERKKNIDEFVAYIENDDEKCGSSDILSRAVSLSGVKIDKIFSEDADQDEIDKIFEEMMIKNNAFREETRKKEEEGDAKENKSQGNSSGKKKSESEKSDDSSSRNGIRTERSRRKNSDSEENVEGKADEKATLSSLSEKLTILNSALADVVKGQDAAILKFIKGYAQGEILRRSEDRPQPRSYFFFFGPPGVGKTLLANTAADALGLPFKVFNMSEYAGHQAHEELLGVASFYSQSKEGTLVKYVKENPECVLLFDEIEKAHINVIRQFLQILGSGTLDNKNKDKQVSFKKTIIIFTSNVGRSLFSDRTEKFSALPEKVLTDIIASEKNANGEPVLPIEICSRIASGTSVMFDHLSVRQLADLVRSNFDKVVEGMKEEYGVRVTYSKYLPLLFLFNYGAEIDARIATSQSGNFIKNEIYELLRQMDNSQSSKDAIKSIKLDVDWNGMESDLKRLFVNSEKAEMLVLADSSCEVFNSLDEGKYIVHQTASIEEAKELLNNDLTAIFIDPIVGTRSDNEKILSITDYNTDGIKFFRHIIETRASIPVYMLETDRVLTTVDRDTFAQEGAFGVLKASDKLTASFKNQLAQIVDELYMENENQKFSQRGFVIGFGTKQKISDDGKATILFYDLKRTVAVDSETRSSILLDGERPDIHFKDVIGASKAKEELGRFVSYLANPKKYLASGGKPSKGVLLYGPPGTGKTMLAKAMAGESDVTFFQKSATDFMNSYYGQSEESVRQLFKMAKKYAPSIIFIDEIDAIGKKRIGSSSTAYTEQILNALLTQMDGFSVNDVTKPVFVLAATNYGVKDSDDSISELDPALVRRFSNRIKVDLPNESERREYIHLFLDSREIKTLSDQGIDNFASRTTGQSIAIIQNILETAFNMAYDAGRDMSDNDILTALEDYEHGEKKEHTEDYYRRVAFHETGHAYISYLNGIKPAYLTIESRGDFGGYMQPENSEQRTGYSKDELIGIIRSSLAGRCAEQEFYDEEIAINTGASSDLQHATDIAFSVICRYGMSDSLIVLNRSEIMQSSLASDYIARVDKLLKEQMAITREMIKSGRDVIEKIAGELVKESKLTGARFEELMEENTKKND